MSDLFHNPTCATCQTPTPSVPPPLSWSPAVQAGRRVWTCPECARANIHNIEGRLDPAWW
jgi:hypothetical protein